MYFKLLSKLPTTIFGVFSLTAFDCALPCSTLQTYPCKLGIKCLRSVWGPRAGVLAGGGGAGDLEYLQITEWPIERGTHKAARDPVKWSGAVRLPQPTDLPFCLEA